MITVETASDLITAVLALPPESFAVSETLWSAEQAGRPPVPFRKSEFARFSEGAGLLSTARQSHLTLISPNGADEPELIGSGVAVSYDGHYGILTARHVLYDGEHIRPHREIVVSPAPTRPRQFTRITGHSLGSCSLYSFVSPDDHPAPPPGVPDLTLVVVEGESLPQRISTDCEENYSATEWLDLADDQRTVVEIEDAEMNRGLWVLSACDGERSRPGSIRANNIVLHVDKAYKRGGYEYFGSFHDEVGASRDEGRSFGGASGGGLWKQRLTERGKQKLRGTLSEPLAPEDLANPVLAGIAFFDMYHEDPKQSMGHGYRRELYFHRLNPPIVDLMRRVLAGELLQGRDDSRAQGG